MKKNCKLHLGISSELKEQLIRKANDLGITLTAYCTLILKFGGIKEDFPKEILK